MTYAIYCSKNYLDLTFQGEMRNDAFWFNRFGKTGIFNGIATIFISKLAYMFIRFHSTRLQGRYDNLLMTSFVDFWIPTIQFFLLVSQSRKRLGTFKKPLKAHIKSAKLWKELLRDLALEFCIKSCLHFRLSVKFFVIWFPILKVIPNAKFVNFPVASCRTICFSTIYWIFK